MYQFKYNPNRDEDFRNFTKNFADLFLKKYTEKHFKEVVFICIGIDRSTGDALGPIVGSNLAQTLSTIKNVYVYGTLESPIHAKNLECTLQLISFMHDNALKIAIDSSLINTLSKIGLIFLKDGSIKPGLGVKNNLPAVGDLSIAGTVGISSLPRLVHTAPFYVVKKLADFISIGIQYSIKDCIKTLPNYMDIYNEEKKQYKKSCQTNEFKKYKHELLSIIEALVSENKFLLNMLKRQDEKIDDNLKKNLELSCEISKVNESKLALEHVNEAMKAYIEAIMKKNRENIFRRILNKKDLEGYEGLRQLLNI